MKDSSGEISKDGMKVKKLVIRNCRRQRRQGKQSWWVKGKSRRMTNGMKRQSLMLVARYLMVFIRSDEVNFQKGSKRELLRI